jgi:hypothetical protein
VRQKEIEFTAHEYVKLNEVSALISNAIQGVLDKIHQKDKTTQQNKSTLRKVENKILSLEQQVGCLMGLTSGMKDITKKVKELKVELSELALTEQNNDKQSNQHLAELE